MERKQLAEQILTAWEKKRIHKAVATFKTDIKHMSGEASEEVEVSVLIQKDPLVINVNSSTGGRIFSAWFNDEMAFAGDGLRWKRIASLSREEIEENLDLREFTDAPADIIQFIEEFEIVEHSNGRALIYDSKIHRQGYAEFFRNKSKQKYKEAELDYFINTIHTAADGTVLSYKIDASFNAPSASIGVVFDMSFHKTDQSETFCIPTDIVAVCEE